MSDTPETDALISVGLENADRECVPADFARKLERERDEAIRKLENLKADAIHSCHNGCQRPICVLRRERDEARVVAGELADIASKHLSFLLAVTPAKTNDTHEKDTMKVIDALKRWKKL
jgi:hypothetical protein